MCYYHPAATGRQQLFDQLGKRKRNERFQDGQPPFKAELPREIVLIFFFFLGGFCFVLGGLFVLLCFMSLQVAVAFLLPV
jgi:hypothetical protein